jgi:hypothetical protein
MAYTLAARRGRIAAGDTAGVVLRSRIVTGNPAVSLIRITHAAIGWTSFAILPA